MPHSLRAKLRGLQYKGILKDKEYNRLCHALDLEKSGHWIPIPYQLDYEYDAECALCHEQFINAMDYNYCPKCGATMKEVIK